MTKTVHICLCKSQKIVQEGKIGGIITEGRPHGQEPNALKHLYQYTSVEVE
jgi:predicted urease superfamily metal-dependent hydrolase